jgi:YrbI family 3-deoxy-D-manno-octulosonate 8-phosphate phosphatase
MKHQKKNNIKALVLDIDGVLTDGTVAVDGSPAKRIFLRDLDALSLIRRKGILVAFLTGESEAEAASVVNRCGSGLTAFNAKDKEAGIKEIARQLKLELAEICYIGDARRDIPALKIIGLSLCPFDGDKLAKDAADMVLQACGGKGAVAEAVDLILGI